MIPIALFIISIFTCPLALSAPTSLGADTLLQNGQAAQQLNAEFKTLKANTHDIVYSWLEKVTSTVTF
jgi:hypothetical protein